MSVMVPAPGGAFRGSRQAHSIPQPEGHEGRPTIHAQAQRRCCAHYLSTVQRTNPRGLPRSSFLTVPHRKSGDLLKMTIPGQQGVVIAKGDRQRGSLLLPFRSASRVLDG